MKSLVNKVRTIDAELIKGAGLAIFLAFALLVPNALAQGPTPDTIVNGSFETGDYTGWTLWEGPNECPGCGTWGIASTGQTINQGDSIFDYHDSILVQQFSPGLPHTFFATDGNFTAFQLQLGAQTHRMYQDIHLGSCKTLSWDLSYDNHLGSFDPNSQYIAMNIRDTSDNIVQTLYKTTQGVDPLVLPATTFTHDVSAYLGSTIRLDLTLVVNLWFFDAFVIDNFRLSDCNQPPTAEAGGPYVVALGEQITLDGSGSSDPDGDTLTYSWAPATNLGGTETDEMPIYTGNVVGIEELTLTVGDGKGGSDSATTLVVTYDPDGGFVTGGGWIVSPEGACEWCAVSPGDKANFGFVSKYKKGVDIPTGQTEFQFQAGGLNFHSSSYEWLVVANHKAQYKGVGTINGGGEFGFMLTAIDANLTPSTDVDLFRIKIWDKSNGDAIVYDNQMNAADDADPTTAIGGGSIVIHTKGKK